MNLRQIQQFLAVAELGSVSRAAEQLHMAQPPLSMAIKRLEADIGGPLFIRERRGLRLTALGRAILEDARQIAFHFEHLRKTAVEASEGVSGTLRIGFVGSATYRLFPRVLPVFRERYPRVILELREQTTTQILREIESGVLDLGLLRYPVFESTSAALLPVEHDALVAALPVSSPLAAQKRLRLQDLAEQPFILYSSSAALNLRAQVIAACQAAGFTPQVVQEAVQVQTVVSLVESGMGVALVPSVSQSQAPAGVAFRALASERERLVVSIAVATRKPFEPQTATRFRELLVELAE